MLVLYDIYIYMQLKDWSLHTPWYSAGVVVVSVRSDIVVIAVIKQKQVYVDVLSSQTPCVFCVQDSIMKDGMANNSTASISQARKSVEQLKMEACMDRIKVCVV